MKTYLLSCTLLLLNIAMAQTVKVKKDKVLFDGEAVAKIKTKGTKYTYSSLDESKSVTVRLEAIDGGHNLHIKNPTSDEEKMVPMEWYSISINLKKGVAELLAKKYNIITDNGIENVEALFSNGNGEEEPEVSEEEKMELLIADYEKRLKNNKNIKRQQGYFIDKDGKKWKGEVTMEFDPLIDPRKDTVKAQLSSLKTNFGRLDYLDEEDNPAYKIFRAKRGDRVCIVNNDNSETCFVGIKLKTEKLLTADTKLEDALMAYAYYEIVYQGLESLIFRNPVHTDELGLKINEEEGILFTENRKRNVANVERYLGCRPNGQDVDFTNTDSLITLLKHYEDNCR